MNVRLTFASLCLLFAPPLLLPGSAAHAAPQLLGVVASSEPIPMTCDGDRCSAELSAFCLEQGRSGPQDGAAYRALDPRPLSVVATLADGSSRRLAAVPEVQFASARGYSAITVSVPEAMRVEWGAERFSVVVGAGLTLVPVAAAGDPQPVTDEEIGEATGHLRPIASDLFEAGERPALVAIRVINRLINALPSSAGTRTIDLVARDGLWDRAVGGEPRIDDPDPARAQASLVFESCRRGATYVQGLTLRRCLEASHDAMMSSVNEAYWRLVGTGS